eukprot:s1705_g13.t1
MSEGGGSCLHRGSRKIFKRSGIQPTCAKLQSGQFEEFPKCVERCHHFFDDFPFLVFNQQACDSCTPVPVVRRKCSPDSLMLGAPPACMASLGLSAEVLQLVGFGVEVAVLVVMVVAGRQQQQKSESNKQFYDKAARSIKPTISSSVTTNTKNSILIT